MKIKQRLLRSPNATPMVGVSVRVRLAADLSTLALLTTDADGYVEYQTNGSPGDVLFHVEEQPGGEKYWDSYDRMAVGPLCLDDVPTALAVLGNGVIWGQGQNLNVVLGSGDTLRVQTGGALIRGIPIMNYTFTAATLVVVRPSASTRIDRVVVRLYPPTSATTPGKAEFALVAGVPGGSAPLLGNDDELVEISLAQVEVPVAAPIVITDERQLAGSPGDEVSVARISTTSTESAGGAALSGLSVTLDLPKNRLYTIDAQLSGVQASVDLVTPLATYGSLGSGTSPNFQHPQHLAIDSSGNVFVADQFNNRLVKLNSSGAFVAQITGLTNIIGVAVDSSGNIYTISTSSGITLLSKYSASFVQQAGALISSTTARHIATDDTHLYLVASNSQIQKRPCANINTLTASWGSTGTGNGQFQLAAGIATDGTHVYVSDFTLDRISKFTPTGTFVTKWGVSGSGDGQLNEPYGLAYDSANALILVADSGNARIQRFEPDGTFADAFGSLGSALGEFNTPTGAAVRSGIVWVSESSNHRLQTLQWGSPGSVGYGQIAIEIDSVVSAYTGIGEIVGSVANGATATKQGPASVVVRGFGKATDGRMTLNSAVLSARATAT